MSSSVRRHRRERARRAGAVMIKCHVCGREGPRRSMVHRDERWVCRKVPACMERVFNPPPPPLPPVRWAADSFTSTEGFQLLGFISEDGAPWARLDTGIQHRTDAR